MLPLLLLLTFSGPTLGALNGRCSPTLAKGVWKDHGICVKTTTCDYYDGATITGACPNDPVNVKCCYINPCSPRQYPGSSVVFSECKWTSQSCPAGRFLNGYCPGASNYKCCEI